MTAFLVFNELSATGTVTSIASAKRCLDAFPTILLDQRIKGKKVLVTPEHFLGLDVAQGYTIGRWLAEYRGEDREARLRIKTLVDKRSFYTDCVPAEELGQTDVEYKCGSEASTGFLVAHLLGGLGVSIQSAERWNAPFIDLEKWWIEEKEVRTRLLSVPHCCRVDHLESHAEWLHSLGQQAMPTSGTELWNNRQSLFPNLDFCESVAPQIQALSGNAPRFKAILRGFLDLQRYCETWTQGGFDIHQLSHASGESGPTLDMYSEERTFLCPDGEYRVFEWHLKRGDCRIHFYDFPESRQILVGYAGDHLRISSQ